MGIPSQELLSSKLNCNSLIYNGGAILDYMSGENSRVPAFFIKLKLEWLHRIIKEPRTYFHRFLKVILFL